MNDARTTPSLPKPIWVVDDDTDLLKGYERLLKRAGFEVVTSTSGAEAERFARDHVFDAIVSDISMPDMTGIDLLRAVRKHDLDVPLILVTGDPSIESAMQAIELGVFRYLTKPIDPGPFIEAVKYAVFAHRMARLKLSALELVEHRGWDFGDRATLDQHFDRALSGLWMAYQPIVAPRDVRVAAYEALVRVSEPAFPHPGALFDAAERLDRVTDLGRAIRNHIAATQASAPANVDVFVNLHSQDLDDETLYDSSAPLTRIADRVVLEITERASLSRIKNVRGRIEKLKSLGFRIAIDDLGAGYAGLTSFADLSPHVVKLDMSLVRDIDREPIKERLVRSMTEVCRDMSIEIVAEGVETEGERALLSSIGCDFLQGYYFAKPARPYPKITA